ncbi:MAG TPA: SDR family oxidoreductase [Candidatus Saccharimonadia bacterium]|nr:SDR family oxidoreductase [Candidatus Saccharimonadia bacterium]
MDGKTVVITGASSGIGEATAKRLAADGAKVVLVARRKDRLDSLAKDIKKHGGEALVIEADVTQKAAAKDILKQTLKKFGKIDVLINNAGVMLNGPAQDTPLEDWEQMVNLNILGLLYLTHTVLPHFRKQKSGHIVNISSVAGRTTRAGSAVYNATKWGVNAFTDALRQEIAGDKLRIRTTLIEPGAVATELQSHLRPKSYKEFKKNFGDIEMLHAGDIADAIHFALTRPERVNINEILIRPTEQPG